MIDCLPNIIYMNMRIISNETQRLYYISQQMRHNDTFYLRLKKIFYRIFYRIRKVGTAFANIKIATNKTIQNESKTLTSGGLNYE